MRRRLLSLALLAIPAALGSCHGAPPPGHPPLVVPPGVVQVLVFVTPDCPIANSYAPELARLANDLTGTEVELILVYVDPDVDAVAAREHMREHGLWMAMALDPTQDLAHSVGATVTPEAAVCTAAGVQYLGRIDDRWKKLGTDGQQAEHHDLRDAIAAVRQGKPVPNPRTQAVGCLLPTARR